MMSCSFDQSQSPDEGEYLRLRMGEFDYITNCDPCDPHCQVRNIITSAQSELL